MILLKRYYLGGVASKRKRGDEALSVSSSIDVQLSYHKEIKISKVRLINELVNFGWTFNDNGQVSYLPIGDKDEFAWQRDNISIESLMRILQKKQELDEIIGIAMTWKNTNIGGAFLFINNGKINISLSINRKLLNDGIINTKSTDVTWYLQRLLPVFNQGDLMVESFSYYEHV